MLILFNIIIFIIHIDLKKFIFIFILVCISDQGCNEGWTCDKTAKWIINIKYIFVEIIKILWILNNFIFMFTVYSCPNNHSIVHWNLTLDWQTCMELMKMLSAALVSPYVFSFFFENWFNLIFFPSWILIVTVWHMCMCGRKKTPRMKYSSVMQLNAVILAVFLIFHFFIFF